MFIDNLSVEPIAVHHIGYIPAVERQNHSVINIWKYVYCIIYDTKSSDGLMASIFVSDIFDPTAIVRPLLRVL
jgi:hypothetical protein